MVRALQLLGAAAPLHTLRPRPPSRPIASKSVRPWHSTPHHSTAQHSTSHHNTSHPIPSHHITSSQYSTRHTRELRSSEQNRRTTIVSAPESCSNRGQPRRGKLAKASQPATAQRSNANTAAGDALSCRPYSMYAYRIRTMVRTLTTAVYNLMVLYASINCDDLQKLLQLRPAAAVHVITKTTAAELWAKILREKKNLLWPNLLRLKRSVPTFTI